MAGEGETLEQGLEHHHGRSRILHCPPLAIGLRSTAQNAFNPPEPSIIIVGGGRKYNKCVRVYTLLFLLYFVSVELVVQLLLPGTYNMGFPTVRRSPLCHHCFSCTRFGKFQSEAKEKHDENSRREETAAYRSRTHHV